MIVRLKMDYFGKADGTLYGYRVIPDPNRKISFQANPIHDTKFIFSYAEILQLNNKI